MSRVRFKNLVLSTVAIPFCAILSGCGGDDGGATSSTPSADTATIKPIVGAATAAPTTAAAVAAPTCVAGSWAIGNDANQVAPVKYQTAHFAFRWNGTNATMAQAQAAGTQLEGIWNLFINTVGFQQPWCSSTTKYKVNITIDPSYGLQGGYDGQNYPMMQMAAGGLADHWGLAHEFTHALQAGTNGLRSSLYTDWFWEDHANFMAHQQDEYKDDYHCTELRVNVPHIYYGSTRDRYCSWQFFEYLRNTYGYSAVNNIWSNAPKDGDPAQSTTSPFSVLMKNMGWSVSQLNDVFATWAAHNVAWDYVSPTGYNESSGMFAAYGQYNAQDAWRLNRTVKLDPMDLANRRFSSPFFLAPQRWGYNLVKLVPDAGKTSITVTFRGVKQTNPNTTSFPGLVNEPATVSSPNSDWRWEIVAIDSAGKARYGTLMKGSDNSSTFALKTGDKAVYMVVMGTPSAMQNIQFDQAYYTVYRYPYMVQFSNAYPDGFQPSAPAPFANAHKHSNGGGWVSNSATVAATAYVGPYAQVRGGSVTGTARIEDHAVIVSGQISGNARVGAATVVDNGVVIKDNAVVQMTFMGPGFFETGAVIGGTAKLRGDVELRGGPTLTAGTYSGFVDQSATTAPEQGSTQTQMFPEITATPNFTWR